MLIVRGRERERDKERLCAAAARSRIHGFAKSLLTTESTDWDGLYRIPFLIVCVAFPWLMFFLLFLVDCVRAAHSDEIIRHYMSHYTCMRARVPVCVHHII